MLEVLKIAKHRDPECDDLNYDFFLHYKIVNVYRIVRYRLHEEQAKELIRSLATMVDNKVLYRVIRSEGVLVRDKWY